MDDIVGCDVASPAVRMWALRYTPIRAIHPNKPLD